MRTPLYTLYIIRSRWFKASKARVQTVHAFGESWLLSFRRGFRRDFGLFAAQQLVYRPGQFGVAQPLAVGLWRRRGELALLSRRRNHSDMSTECERTGSGVFSVFFYMTRAARSWHPPHGKSSAWQILRMANPPHGNAKLNTSFSDFLFSFTRFLAILHPAMQNYSRFIKKVAEIFGTFKIYVQICSVNLLPIAETYLKWELTLLNEKASLMLCPLAHWNLRNFKLLVKDIARSENPRFFVQWSKQTNIKPLYGFQEAMEQKINAYHRKQSKINNMSDKFCLSDQRTLQMNKQTYKHRTI